MNAIERIKNQNLLQEANLQEESLQQKYQNSLKQIEELKNQCETLKSEKEVLEKQSKNTASRLDKEMQNVIDLKSKMKKERKNHRIEIGKLRKTIDYVVIAGIIATLVAYFI